MDLATIAPPPSATASFPAGSVETRLRAELIESVKAEAAIRGDVLPAAPADLAKAPVHVDSLVVVTILCAVEPIVGCELPHTVVRAGGYISVDSAIENLLPRIEKEWTKRKGSKP